ncbi:MAG: class I SAM-dependent methyltransferase [Lachnospiraceae bacterium]|nr:class I SAM-dependent methyltransferase [Lachnospiraceae bacterium]
MEKIGGVTMDLTYYSGSDSYSDGDEIENRILQIVKEEDYSFSHKEFTSWPILYHLSRQRENIAEPMVINEQDEVLEIGAGMGAVTGAIARRAKSVDCIDLSKRRSLVNAYRHKDFDNINLIVGNFQSIPITKKYDVVTLIGVFEYAYYYIDSDEPFTTFLKKVHECLKPGGRLYIAIENKLGMKYFAGYNEDHTGRPYSGIEGYKEDDHVRTFTKSQLKNMLTEGGFCEPVFYYPFPDYKLPTVIYDEDTIKNMKVDYAEKSNYDSEIYENFNQVKAFHSLAGTEEISIFANSFLIEAVKE